MVAALTQAIVKRGARPRSLTLDNGSEFAGRAMELWASNPACNCALSGQGVRSRTALLKASMADSEMSVSMWSGLFLWMTHNES